MSSCSRYCGVGGHDAAQGNDPISVDAAARFECDGFVVTPPLLSAIDLEQLDARIAGIQDAGAGSRQLLHAAWCAQLAQNLKLHPRLRMLLPADAMAVQCTYFEKSRKQNWLVALHQDLSIPVARRLAHPDLGGWSEKEGTVFVQPPADVLSRLVAVRLHVDDCGLEDGPLRVVPGSHRAGRLDNSQALASRAEAGERACAVPKGAALVMRPLLLHASSKAAGNNRRRVLHFLFGPPGLPHGLQWQCAV